MLAIYDKNGTIFLSGTGFPTPYGALSFLEIEVPEGKYFDGVDVSVDPPQPIFKDIPKSKEEQMEEEIEMLKNSIIEMSKDVYA